VNEAASNAGAGSGTTAARQRVVELDGTRAGPVDRGVCTDLVEARLFFHFLLIILD